MVKVVRSVSICLLSSVEALGDQPTHVGFNWSAIGDDFGFGGFIEGEVNEIGD
jgi:hypothetical protein